MRGVGVWYGRDGRKGIVDNDRVKGGERGGGTSAVGGGVYTEWG